MAADRGRRRAHGVSEAVRLPLVVVLGLLFLLGACGNSGRTITVVSYNVQNLYDATDDGGEYREFTTAGGWSDALYAAKLRAIGSALRAAVAGGADLVALQEVEHYGAARRLVDLELARHGYRHVVWLPDAHSANGPVVLSKLPVRRVGALWMEGSPEQPLRPILEVEVALGEAADAPSLFLFNNHWKSKRGGAAETEQYRRQAAESLAARLREIHAADPAADVIVAGDLNVSVDEYERRQRRYVTALMPAAAAAGSGALPVTATVPPPAAPLVLFSPWYDYRGAGRAPEGSYRFRGTWETIDHLLLSPGLFDAVGVSYAGSDRFAVISDGLLDSAGSPRRFLRGPSPGGYSDHLPLRLELDLHPPQHQRPDTDPERAARPSPPAPMSRSP